MMTRKIYKYALHAPGDVTVLKDLPTDSSDIVHFGVDGEGYLSVWILHNDLNSVTVKDLSLIIVGTGWEIEPFCSYVDTTVVDKFVWHLFKVNNVDIGEGANV